jgi:hypothetical protein
MTFPATEYPPSREGLIQGHAIGAMSHAEFDAAMCQHFPTMCADCARKITPDSAMPGLYVAVRQRGHDLWFEHACRSEIVWDGGPTLWAADLHCVDMADQRKIRDGEMVPLPSVELEMPSEAPVGP